MDCVRVGVVIWFVRGHKSIGRDLAGSWRAPEVGGGRVNRSGVHRTARDTARYPGLENASGGDGRLRYSRASLPTVDLGVLASREASGTASPVGVNCDAKSPAIKRVESATALIWKLLLVAEKRFRRLDAPHLLKDVFEGRKFEDGKPVSTQQRKNAA